MRQLPLLVLVVFLVGAGSASAQETRVPMVNAGEVASVILQVPAPGEAGTAHYTLALDPAYRTFVPDTATVERMDDTFIIPITFATPERLPAGEVVAGSIELAIEGYETTRRELLIRINERHAVTFSLEADELTIAPDGVTGIPFTARNRGNLTDTVYLSIRALAGWALVNAPQLVLAPGDSAQGALRVAAPVSATPGDRQILEVTASTGAQELTRTANVVVVSPSGWLGDLAHVPSSLFIGQALGSAAGPVVALTGKGRIGPETEVQIDLRHSEGVVDPALQRRVAGARLRAVLTRPDLRVEAGDVYGFQSTISGSLRRARGIESEYDPAGPLAFRSVAAVPMGFNGEIDGGHILYGEAGHETPFGQVSVLGGDMLHPALSTLPETRSTGAGLRWSRDSGLHTGSVEATLVRFSAGDSVQRSGPALDAQYRLNGQRLNGRLRVRRVPDAATNPGGRGNEISGSLNARVAPSLYVVAWGYDVEQNLLGATSNSASRAGSAGLRSGFGAIQLQVSGNLLERSVANPFNAYESTRRTIRTEASYTRGSLAVQSDLELGTSNDFGREGDYQAVGGSVRVYGDGRWGWVRVQNALRPGGLRTTNINLGGSATLGPVDLSGGLSRSYSGSMVTTSFWTGTEIQAQRNLTIHIGASARPTLASADWSFSIGLVRRLNLPLPIAREPDLYGLVFDDANGNSRLDAGERPVAGVPLNLGFLEDETGDDGRFAFLDATGAPLRIRSNGLPIGYVVSPRVILPTRGQVHIPLVKTATLTLDLFLDRDEDGQRDPAESVGAGVSVTLTNPEGRQWTVTGDAQGRARISNLLPGRYEITARPPARAGRETDPEVLMEVELDVGEQRETTLAVPLRRRTIRMGGDSGAGLQFFEQNR